MLVLRDPWVARVDERPRMAAARAPASPDPTLRSRRVRLAVRDEERPRSSAPESLLSRRLACLPGEPAREADRLGSRLGAWLDARLRVPLAPARERLRALRAEGTPISKLLFRMTRSSQPIGTEVGVSRIAIISDPRRRTRIPPMWRSLGTRSSTRPRTSSSSDVGRSSWTSGSGCALGGWTKITFWSRWSLTSHGWKKVESILRSTRCLTAGGR